RNRSGHFRELSQRPADHSEKDSLRHRTSWQILPKRNYPRQLHLPYMWVYTSWQIILLGSEIAFALQNRDTYMLEENASRSSPRARILLALALCAETARRAKEKTGGPFAAEEFARQQGISHRFTNDILDELVRQNVLAEVNRRPGEFLLCRCGDTLTVADITKAMLDDGVPLSSLGLKEPSATIQEFSEKLDATLENVFATPLAEA
ncbi:MAG: hypothetical protein PHU80_03370, partial [Kiritimatiellae bacterium]|nr:hypothetical protein [Kiritimatiellia bacterium]